jgi:hypothetical protein
MIPCSWKEHFGIECMTCGFQRSFLQLIKGELVDSFLLFPATLPLLLTFIVLVLHLLFRLKNGALAITGLFALSAVLILINFSIRLISTVS